VRVKERQVGRAREKETIEDGVPLRKKVYTIGLHFSSFCERDLYDVHVHPSLSLSFLA